MFPSTKRSFLDRGSQSRTPSWQTLWVWSSFPNHITTSACHICKTSFLQSQTLKIKPGEAPSSQASTLTHPSPKTLCKSNTADRNGAASSVRGLAQPREGGPRAQLLRNRPPPPPTGKEEGKVLCVCGGVWGGGRGRHKNPVKWRNVLL